MADCTINDIFDKLGICSTSLNRAKEVIATNKETGNVICLVGEAGIGKTQIVHQFAKTQKPKVPFTWKGKTWTDEIPVITLYLAHMQPEDISIPFPEKDQTLGSLYNELSTLISLEDYARHNDISFKIAHELTDNIDILHQVSGCVDRIKTALKKESKYPTFDFLISKELCDLPPEGILFLDEWNRASREVVKSFFTLIENRTIHGKEVIPPGIQIVAAMNPSEMSYSVNEAEKDPAIRRRLTFIGTTHSLSEWLKWAKNGGDVYPAVREFIETNPSALYDRALRKAGAIYPNPAAWEKVSNICKATVAANLGITSDASYAAMAGQINISWASHFKLWVENTFRAVQPGDILFKYPDVRNKVIDYVTEGRWDILNEVCYGVAATLFSAQPTVDMIANNLSDFLCDLPREICMSLITFKFTACKHDTSDENYQTRLNMELLKNERYATLAKELTTDIANVSREFMQAKA